ncbi:MAG: PIN domain-containing protein [Chloroflexota bacterium]|nr:PIN domain-containing protein [Chloroflexota bacterium]
MDERFVVDTHPLAWYLDHGPSLSPTASHFIAEAFDGRRHMLLPIIVLAELVGVMVKRRVRFDHETFVDRLPQTGFQLLAFDEPVLRQFYQLPTTLDIHDRIIVATALVYNASVVTKDEKIVASATVPVVW